MRAWPCALLLCTARAQQNYSFGSTPLGDWLQDTDGLPSFAFNLTHLAAAAPAIYSDVHLVGNDRVFAFVAADGGASLRQDEGGPKLLNDFAPDLFQYAGGIGWLFADGLAAPQCDTNLTPSAASRPEVGFSASSSQPASAPATGAVIGATVPPWLAGAQIMAPTKTMKFPKPPTAVSTSSLASPTSRSRARAPQARWPSNSAPGMKRQAARSSR